MAMMVSSSCAVRRERDFVSLVLEFVFESLLGQRKDVCETAMGCMVKVPPASTSGRKLWGPLQCVPQGLEISGDLGCLLHWRWEGRWAIVDTDFQTLLFGPKGHGDSSFPKWLRLRPSSLVLVSLLRHHKANSNRLQSDTRS